MNAFTPLIQPSPRSNVFGAAIIIILALLFSFLSFLSTFNAWFAIISLALIVVALIARDIQSLHLSLFTAGFIMIPYLNPTLRGWPYQLFVPLLCYGIIVLIVSPLRSSVLWLQKGILDKNTVFTIAIISVVSAIALVLWYAILKPDLSVQMRNMPKAPVWLFPIDGLAFAVCNAAMEEFAFRGIIMQALDSAAGAGLASLLAQAWLFGAMHYMQGFPRGGWGVAMTFAYGIMLGGLRRRSRGMLAPWAAHVCADTIIFIILAWIILGKTAAL